MVRAPRHDGQVIAALSLRFQRLPGLHPLPVGIKLHQHLCFGPRCDLDAHPQLGDALLHAVVTRTLARALFREVARLREPREVILVRAALRRVEDVARQRDLALRRQEIGVPLIAAEVCRVRLVLDVPHALARVVDAELPLPALVLRAQVVFEAITPRASVPQPRHAEGVVQALRDTTRVDHHARGREVQQPLARDGEAPAAALGNAQRGRAHYLKVGRDAAVHLVDVVLLEEHRIAEETHAPREVARAARVHGVAVGLKALEHVPVEGIAELACVDRPPVAAP